MRPLLPTLLIVLTLAACQSKPVNDPPTDVPIAEPKDPYLWLEEVEGQKALDYVKGENKKTMKNLEKLPYYKQVETDIRKIILAKDRIPTVTYNGGYVYNFWQDDKNVRGLWRRAPLAEYKKKNIKWETLLNLDVLAKNEKENWVWKGAECLKPSYSRCLLSLSRGGKDARVVREFDMSKKEFVAGGFYFPEAKTDAAYMDADTLIVGTDWGKGSLTKSGYPNELRLIKRGQKMAEAKSVLKVSDDSVGAWAGTDYNTDGAFTWASDSKDFYTNETFRVRPDGSLEKIVKPLDAEVHGIFRNQWILSLRSAWQGFDAGSLVSIPAGEPNPKAQLIFEPNSRQSVGGSMILKDFVVLNILDNVEGKAFKADFTGGRWRRLPIPFPSKGDLELIHSDPMENILLANFMNFLTPASVMVTDLSAATPVEIYQQAPARFDASQLITEQFEAKSKDGTRIPYFVIRPNKPGPYPTLLTGYGGFEIPETPYYLGATGKVWSEQGGAYVLANIRGGGEFGPKWHQVAVKENRQIVFDDFIAIAEDLIERRITTKNQLAIQGGSNGGLLVGGTFTQRPDLFKAVVCQVPLLDMLRYNKLLAGASWMAEYGNPDDPKMRQIIMKYSPYQNVHRDKDYPEVLFYTSTKDDRVHPGHARKMAARMAEQGHKFLYYENMEGGHGGAANLQQRVKALTIVYSFLRSRLM